MLSTLFGMLTVERLLVEGSCPRRDVGCATGVGWADEWVSGDKDVLSCRQYEPTVAVLALQQGLLIDTVFAVRIICMSWMDP